MTTYRQISTYQHDGRQVVLYVPTTRYNRFLMWAVMESRFPRLAWWMLERRANPIDI